MAKRVFDREAPYQSIANAARLTGLSSGYLRAGCRDGKIACLRVGKEYRICMSLLLRQLEAESAASVGARSL